MATIRKDPLKNDQYYHIFSRSIAKYVIFNNSSEFNRIVEIFSLFRFTDFDYEYSKYFRLTDKEKIATCTNLDKGNNKLVEIIAYCIMPTHFHLILKQIVNNGITKYMSRSLDSYSKYFNTKHKRVGPLWTGRFKNVLIEDDYQFIHLTRYIHLNPTSAGLVKKPQNWPHSSYFEFINPRNDNTKICNYQKVIDMDPKKYKKFVENQKDYQRKIGIIKNLMIDDYTG